MEAELLKETREQPRYHRAALLAFGSYINGAPVALDLRKQLGAVGYISNDVFWENEGARVRKSLAVVASSLAEFARLAVDHRFPIDYFAARRGRAEPGRPPPTAPNSANRRGPTIT